MSGQNRGIVERIGLLVIVLGIFTTVVVGGLLRVLKVSPDLEVEGWTIYYTYPLAEGFFVLGIVLGIIGVAVTVLGKALR